MDSRHNFMYWRFSLIQLKRIKLHNVWKEIKLEGKEEKAHWPKKTCRLKVSNLYRNAYHSSDMFVGIQKNAIKINIHINKLSKKLIFGHLFSEFTDLFWRWVAHDAFTIMTTSFIMCICLNQNAAKFTARKIASIQY